MKIVLDDKIHAFQLISSFIKSWETMVVSCSNSVLNIILTISQVTNSFLNEETIRKAFEPSKLQTIVLERGV